MPENPSGERTGMVVILTPPNSARRYQYIIRDSLFYDRNNDVEMVYGVIGQFNEEVTISNVTVSNSQIASSGAVLFSIFKLNIDGMYFDSNTQNGQIFINIFSCFFVTASNIVLDNNVLMTSSTELIKITGVGSSLTMSNISITNTDLLSSPAVH